MQLERIAILQGHRPIISTRNLVLTTKKQYIYRWTPNTGALEKICRLPNSAVDFVTRNNRFTRRMFRYGVRCGAQINNREYLVSDSRNIYCINIETGTVKIEKSLAGQFRPLAFASVYGITGFKDGLYYGDYGSNPNHSSMEIHFREPDGTWKSVFKFPAQTIDHIHAIIPDTFQDSIWILTGDLDNAAAIWMAKDGFQNIKPIIFGSQTARSCIAYPTKHGLLYATDSHLEPNSIRLLEFKTPNWVSTPIREIAGSCIYGTQVGKNYFLSTAYEPGNPSGYFLLDLFDWRRGPGILTNHCELVAGNFEDGFTTILQRQVDILPKRLFQFSTFVFPTANQTTELLVAHSIGLKQWDEVTEVFKII